MPRRGALRPRAQRAGSLSAGSEGRVVAVAAGSAPGVGARRRAGGRPRLLGDLLTRRAAAAGGRRAGDLCGRVAQRRADLVDLQLDGGAVVALAVLVGALLEPPGRDDAHALGQRARDVLRELA